MMHDQATRLLQEHIEPVRACGWFVRRDIFALGYFDESGKRCLLARGEDSARARGRILRDAMAAWDAR